MRALVLQQFGRIGVEEVAEAREPAGDEVRVRIRYTGICGSDIHGYTGENGRRELGQVMGHETVGRIDALGPQAAERGLAVGQAVTFNPLLACGHCEACHAGTEQHCPDRAVIGVKPDLVSAFAEQVTLPAANVVPMGEGTDERHGALVEPLAVALSAARRVGVGDGSAVLVTGGGPIGQSAILAAFRLGASTVFATDISPVRRELCAKLGAEVIDPSAAPTPEQVRARHGRLVDVTIDAVGVAATLADALESTVIGGTVGLVGMGSPELTLSAYRVSTEERSIVGSFCYDSRTFRDAAAWVAEGQAVLDELISGIVPMDGANDAFDRLSRPGDTPGKILVDLLEA